MPAAARTKTICCCPRWPRGARKAAGACVIALVAFAAFAIGAVTLFKQAITGVRAADANAAAAVPRRRDPRSPTRRALIRALWAIHGDVEREPMRNELGQIFYHAEGSQCAEFEGARRAALGAYKSAQTRMQGLEVPASLRIQHNGLSRRRSPVRGVGQRLMKMFSDGRDDHYKPSTPKGQAWRRQIRDRRSLKILSAHAFPD